MLSFKYVARDISNGAKIKADVQAESELAAAKLIREEGLVPIEIKSSGDASKSGRFRGRIKSKDKVLFSRQLSTLINAGLPLVQSLRNVSSQTQNNRLKLIINKVITDVEAGTNFASSLAKYPDVFNQVYVSLIESGEASGTLDKSLERLAIQQEKDAEVISKVRGAMAYPMIVVVVMVAVVTFMLVTVLPQVQLLYDGIGNVQLPITTRVLLAISGFITGFWWAVLLALGFLIFLGSRWFKTVGGKRYVDTFKMKAWPVGSLFMKMYMARFARTGSTLVASGVPLVQMLEITADSVNNIHIAESINKAIEKVKGGKALSDSIRNDPNFLDLVPNMIHIGEESGAIEEMLAKVADYYEREVDNEIKTISTIIEPVMMVMLGVVALIIVVAVLMPVYNLAGQSLL